MSSPQTSQPNQTSQATETTTGSDFAAAAEELRGRDRFLVTTPETPAGDALGSMLALHVALRQLGKDSVMYLSGDSPLPSEYRFMPLEELLRDVPGDAAERTLVAVDCANESRLGPDPEILMNAGFVLNIDHHHDNTRFGNVNVIVPHASSTGEVLADLFELLDVEITPDIAEALYIALV